MGFFGSYKPNVSKKEFRKVKSSLFAKGFKRPDIAEVEKIFAGVLEGTTDYQKGVDSAELSRSVSWMKANMSKHRFSAKKITEIEKAMKKKI